MTRWMGRLYVVLLLASVALHWPGAGSQFTYDDHQFVAQNQSIRSLAEALASFDDPFPPEQRERGLYRPLTNLSYAIDHAVWQLDARGYHITNVLLYALVVLLVQMLALAYGLSRGTAFCVALLFSVHPAHSEVVDGVAGRSELLALLFGLVATVLFLRLLRTPGFREPARIAGADAGRPAALLAGSLLAYLLACLSKETGVVLPAVLAVLWVVEAPLLSEQPRVSLSRAAGLMACFGLVTLGYLALRFAVIGQLSPSQIVLEGVGLAGRLQTMGVVFLEYLRLLVHPVTLQVDYYYQEALGIQSAWSLRAAAGWLALASLALVFALALRAHLRSVLFDASRGRGRDVATILLLGLAFFFVFLLPVSHVFDFGALFAERFVFASSLGFVLVVVALAQRALVHFVVEARVRHGIALALMAALVLPAGWRSLERARDWRNDVRLWSRAVASQPGNPLVLANLGLAHLKQGDAEVAETWLRRSLAVEPENLAALNNLGTILLGRQRLDDAKAVYERVVGLDPDNHIAWNNLGVIETQRQNHSVAAKLYARSRAANPNYVRARENLARSERAIEAAREFLEEQGGEPTPASEPELLLRYSHACFSTGDFDCASRYYQLFSDAAPRSDQPEKGL